MDWASPISAKMAVKSGKVRLFRGNGQAGLGHEGEQAGGLERDGFAARVRAGDDEFAGVGIERERQRGRACFGSGGTAIPGFRIEVLAFVRRKFQRAGFGGFAAHAESRAGGGVRL